MTRRPPPRLAIAGAGRAGGALAAAFAAAGCPVRLWDRRASRSQRVARAAGASAVRRLEALCRGRDVLLVCVADEAIEELALRLAPSWPPADPPASVLHVAGAVPSSALAPLAGHGTATGVLHPVAALDGPRSAARLEGAAATVSGDAPAVRVARDLARRIGLRPVRVRDEARPLLHLAAVMAAGDVVGLLGVAARLLGEAGIRGPAARRLLADLARGAVDAFEKDGAARALTGPVARGDAETLARHLDALGRSGLPAADRRGARALHAQAAREGARLLADAGRLDEAAARRVRRALPPDRR